MAPPKSCVLPQKKGKNGYYVGTQQVLPHYFSLCASKLLICKSVLAMHQCMETCIGMSTSPLDQQFSTQATLEIPEELWMRLVPKPSTEIVILIGPDESSASLNDSEMQDEF